MNKLRYVFILILFFIFSYTFNVFAECSYSERKELLNEVNDTVVSIDVKEEKSIRQIVNPNTEEVTDDEYIVNYFDFNIKNLSDNLFIRVSNDYDDNIFYIHKSDFENNEYHYRIDDVDNIITYELTYISLNENCNVEEITTKKVKKAKKNPIFYYSICNNELVKNDKYCKEFIDSEFKNNEASILNYLSNKIKQNEEVTTKKTVNYFNVKNIIFVIAVIILIVFLILFILKQLKRRKEL